MPPDLTFSDFSGRVGEGFRVSVADEAIVLTLADVTSLARANHPGPRRAPFSLIFRGPFRPQLVQRIWPLEHAALGTLDIFLVPIGPDAEGMQYEAVFN